MEGGVSTGVVPYPNFGQIEYTPPVGYGNYNGLQASLTRRFTDGFELRAAFTHSRSLDNTPQELESNSGDPPNGRNYAAWYGPSDFDIPNRVAVSYLYDFPFGRGKSMLQHGPMAWILGNWQTSGVYTYYSGHPFQVNENDGNHNSILDPYGFATATPNLVGKPHVVGDPDCWFYASKNSACGSKAPSGSTDAYAVTAVGAVGNVSRNPLRGPHIDVFDAALLRSSPSPKVGTSRPVGKSSTSPTHRSSVSPTATSPAVASPALLRSPAIRASCSSHCASPSNLSVPEGPAFTMPGLRISSCEPSRMPSRYRALSFCLFAFSSLAVAQSPSPNLVLQGEVHPAQNKTYIEAPFTVPTGTHRITVAFHNLGHDQHTVLDLGIADPFRFRGSSGGNKDRFTVGETDATPSYIPGAIPPGRWKLLISVPNIRHDITSRWRAEVWFDRTLDDSSFTEQPLRDQPGWYRGDFHMHTAHSDGSCPSQSGKPVPCPLFLTAEAAARRGLDFIAISDHNTTSHYDDERELQPYFDKLLFIPGRELTTFYGHANAYGTTRHIDYRVTSAQVPDANAMFRSAQHLGAIVSINHPQSPTGEICMGCGRTPTKPVDMNLVTSVEVVNGGGQAATKFWEQELAQGHRLTAIGGSDNHHADWPPEKAGSIGYPTTVVYAPSLSVAGILSGIRSGRVFIDVTGSRDRLLEMSATAGNASAEMGGALEPHSGETVSLTIHVAACTGASVHFFIDGASSPDLPAVPVSSADKTLHADWHANGARHFLRAEVHDANDRLLLLGNPIYIGFPSQSTH